MQLLDLERYVPLERCRLVRYDDYSETLDQSFEEQEVGGGRRGRGGGEEGRRKERGGGEERKRGEERGGGEWEIKQGEGKGGCIIGREVRKGGLGCPYKV